LGQESHLRLWGHCVAGYSALKGAKRSSAVPSFVSAPSAIVRCGIASISYNRLLLLLLLMLMT